MSRFLEILAHAATIMSVAPVAAGMIRLHRRQPAVQQLWVLVAVAFVLNVAMALQSTRRMPTPAFAQLTHPAYAIVGVAALAAMVRSARGRVACYAGLMVYLVWWIWSGLHMDLTLDFGPYSGPAMNLLLVFSAVVALVDRLRQPGVTPLRDWIVVACLAVLIMHAPGAAIEPVSLVLWPSHREVVRILWAAQATLLLIGTLLLTMALLWTIPPRSSPGSSSSAA